MHDKRYLLQIHVACNYNRFFDIANFNELLKKSSAFASLNNINHKKTYLINKKNIYRRHTNNVHFFIFIFI